MARILVADDEPKLGKLVAEMLQLEGHEVVRVQGGRGALVELSARPFELVVTDLRMPEVDGLAVLRDARGRGAEGWCGRLSAQALRHGRAAAARPAAGGEARHRGEITAAGGEAGARAGG